MDEALARFPMLRDVWVGPTLLLGLGWWLSRRLRPALAQAVLVSAGIASLLFLPGAALVRALDLGLFQRSVVPGEGALPAEIWGLAPGTLGTGGLSFGHLLLLAWGGVSALLLMRLGVCFLAGRRRLATCTELPPQEPVCGVVRALCTRFGTRLPRVLVDDGVQAPLVWGFGRPSLVLPRAVVELEAGAQRGVLVHELAHLARRDAWHQLLSELACALLPFHPLVWIARREQARQAELACDEWVLGLGCDGERYARALLQLTPARAMALAPGLSGKGLLGERIQRVLELREARPALGRLARTTLLIGTGAVAATLAVARSRAPELALSRALPVSELPDLGDEWLGEDVRIYPGVLDLGSAPKDAERRGSLWIVNTGDRVHRVRGARPTCGCVTLSAIEDLDLAPGQAVELPLSMLATAAPGEQAEKRVHVQVEGLPVMEATLRLRSHAP